MFLLYVPVNNLASQSLLQNSSSHHSSATQALTNHLAAVAPSLLAAGAQSQLLAGLGQQVNILLCLYTVVELGAYERVSVRLVYKGAWVLRVFLHH